MTNVYVTMWHRNILYFILYTITNLHYLHNKNGVYCNASVKRPGALIHFCFVKHYIGNLKSVWRLLTVKKLMDKCF